MFEDVLADQNTHWGAEPYPGGVPRRILSKLVIYLDLPHVIPVTGVRRCGKSTLLRQAVNFLMKERGVPPANILFLNLEHPRFNRYKGDPENLERIFGDYLKAMSPKGRVYVLLDEVHFFDNWQVFVKSRYEKKNVKFLVTGSNSRLLSSEFSTLLSGRTLSVELSPFSFGEYLAAKGMNPGDAVGLRKDRHAVRGHLDDYLRVGGFPEPALLGGGPVAEEILATYARNILHQDIASRFAVKRGADLETLFFFLASNVASPYTYSRLADLVGLSDKTVKEYLAYFADAFLLFALDEFSFSVRKQIKSAKKVYAVDTGLASAAAFRFSENRGRLLENLVFLALRRDRREIYSYRPKGGGEVDFLFREGGRVRGLVQAAWTMEDEKTRKRELKSLREAMGETGVKEGTIVTHEDEDEIREGGYTIRVVPAWRYLLEQESA